MGTVGDCYDNAMMESFFSTLQRALLDRPPSGGWQTRKQLAGAIFEWIWKTGRAGNKLAACQTKLSTQAAIPIVFESMALTHAEITDLKSKIRTACPAVDSQAYRSNAAAHQVCTR